MVIVVITFMSFTSLPEKFTGSKELKLDKNLKIVYETRERYFVTLRELSLRSISSDAWFRFEGAKSII